MTSVPLAAAGIWFVLGIAGHSINLMGLMGCVVLASIVVVDAIIKTYLINQHCTAGVQVRAAIIAAGRDRVRPILMTTIATVQAFLPLTLGFGQGSELRGRWRSPSRTD